jgi:DnaJ-class molecular chaperone
VSMRFSRDDLYQVLGLSDFASIDEVKRKYRELALKYHPDRVPEAQKKQAEERFKIINNAYEILTKYKYEYDIWLQNIRSLQPALVFTFYGWGYTGTDSTTITSNIWF